VGLTEFHADHHRSRQFFRVRQELLGPLREYALPHSHESGRDACLVVAHTRNSVLRLLGVQRLEGNKKVHSIIYWFLIHTHTPCIAKFDII